MKRPTGSELTYAAAALGCAALDLHPEALSVLRVVPLCVLLSECPARSSTGSERCSDPHDVRSDLAELPAGATEGHQRLHNSEMTLGGRWVGIDFSGDASQWGAGVRASNVWIAELGSSSGEFVLRRLFRVQRVAGVGTPFERLANFLAAGEFLAAAIDAPFSVPVSFVPGGGHTALLALVSTIPITGSRPFPRAGDFVVAVTGHNSPLVPPKPLRATERYWQKRGINVRSTLWAGHRGGAPFAAACLTLLKAAGRPLWPWSTASGNVVEAFPAAQLHQWKVPHQTYAAEGPTARAARELIVAKLKSLVAVGQFEETLLKNTDALDATVAAFAAVAASSATVAVPPEGPLADDEGWIAVHP